MVTAGDFAAVESRCADAPVNLILMDVQMPSLSGDAAAMVLRWGWGVQARIYLLSSLPREELAERALDAGVDGYISKQAGPDALVTRVGEILGVGGTSDGQQDE